MPVLPLIPNPTLTELNNLGGGFPPKQDFELGTELNDIITAINAGGGAGPWTEAANVVSLTTPGDTVNLNVGAAGELRVNGAAGAAGQVLTSSGAGVAPTWTTPASGTIGGTIAANEVAFGTGVDSIGGDARLTWNPGTGVFEITDVASLPFVTANSTALTLTVANGAVPTTNTLSSSGATVSDGAAAAITVGVAPGVATIDSTALGAGALNLAVGELQVNGAPGAAGEVLTSNGPGVAPTWQAGGGGGIAIGDAVGGSTATNVLYVDGANNLANTSNLTISGSTTTFTGNLQTAGTGGTDRLFLYGISPINWLDTPANSNGAFANLDVSNNWRLMRRVSNSDFPALYLNTSNGNLAVGNNTSPTSLFNVGNSNEFQVNSNGDLVKVRNVDYSFPAAQGAASTVLSNDGAGNLSWVAAPTGTIAGTIAANEVAFGTGADSIGGDPNFTWNQGTGELALASLTAGDIISVSNVVDGNFLTVTPTSLQLALIDPLTPTNNTTINPTDVAVGDGSQSGNVKTGEVSATDNGTTNIVALRIPGGVGTLVSADGSAVAKPLNLSIGELQINGNAGISNQFLKSVGPGGAPVWSTGTNAAPPRVYTVGIDNATIQGCIGLCTSPSSTNAYIVRIPPGSYTENLTLVGSVQLQGMTNPGDTTTVKITGTHTLNGTAVNPLDNRVTVANIVFVNNTNAVTPTFTFTATTATQVNLFGCFLQNTNAATTAKILDIGSSVNCYLTNVVSRMSSVAGSGGTHFTVTGALYSGSGVDVDGGTRCVDVLAGGYAQMNGGQFYCSSGVGGEALRVAAGAILAAGYCAIKNSASAANNAHGVNLLGVNAAMYATWVTFDVLNGASGYVVTGPAGSVYISTACQYSNVPGIPALTRNVKIKNTVTAASFTTTLTSSP